MESNSLLDQKIGSKTISELGGKTVGTSSCSSGFAQRPRFAVRTRTSRSSSLPAPYHPLGIADTDRIVHIRAERRDPGESI
jgi:hypothetical protein